MSNELNYPIILDIVQKFYDKARVDVWIGFHFRVIKNFDEHIPRIADFWQLQLTGKIDHPKSLPFKLLEVHKEMKLTSGQINRWVVLFHETLSEANLPDEIKDEWKKKIELFRSKIALLSSLSCS